MANSATLIDTIPAYYANGNGPVYEYEIVIDTPDTDLTIRAAESAHRHWISSLLLSEGTALNLTFKTATKTQTLELIANQGIYDKAEGGFVFVGGLSEALIVRSSAAIGATVGKNLIVRVVTAPRFNLR